MMCEATANWTVFTDIGDLLQYVMLIVTFGGRACCKKAGADARLETSAVIGHSRKSGMWLRTWAACFSIALRWLHPESHPNAPRISPLRRAKYPRQSNSRERRNR